MCDRWTSQRFHVYTMNPWECFFKCDRKAHRFPFQSSRIRTISTSTRGYPNELPSLPTRVDADVFRKQHWKIQTISLRKKDISTLLTRIKWATRPNKRLQLKMLSCLWERQTKINISKKIKRARISKTWLKNLIICICEVLR